MKCETVRVALQWRPHRRRTFGVAWSERIQSWSFSLDYVPKLVFGDEILRTTAVAWGSWHGDYT